MNFRRMKSNLKAWLYFAMFLPLLLMTLSTILLIKNIDSFTSDIPVYYYIVICLCAILSMGMTLFMFNSIKRTIHNSSKIIYDWSKKIKSGDMSERLSFSKKSDLYYIASSFNSMADIIQNLVAENARKIELLTEKNEDLEELNQSLVSSLVSAIEAKDEYTLGHSERVSKYATQIAKRLNLPPEQVKEIAIAGMLHDVGKIGVSDDILNKPARLSKSEFDEVKRHPAVGTWILNPLNLSKNTINAINSHHERYDGTGYPFGIKGNDISLASQIISISDAFDAMTSERPYRQAMSPKEAIAEIKKSADTQFSPNLVSLIEEADFLPMQ